MCTITYIRSADKSSTTTHIAELLKIFQSIFSQTKSPKSRGSRFGAFRASTRCLPQLPTFNKFSSEICSRSTHLSLSPSPSSFFLVCMRTNILCRRFTAHGCSRRIGRCGEAGRTTLTASKNLPDKGKPPLSSHTWRVWRLCVNMQAIQM